jgi:hypothetical protein
VVVLDFNEKFSAQHGSPTCKQLSLIRRIPISRSNLTTLVRLPFCKMVAKNSPAEHSAFDEPDL